MTGKASVQGTPRLSSSEWDDLIVRVKAEYTLDRAFPEVMNTTLIGRGSSRTACCPFHEDRNPSLSVDISRGFYNCHSAGCGATGDVLTLLQSAYHISFREAVVMAADRVGISVSDNFKTARMASGLAPSRRNAIRCPDDKVGTVPSGLTSPEFLLLPGHIDPPKVGKSLKVWDPAKEGADRARSHVPTMVHAYRSLEGDVQCAILRCVSGARGSQPAKKYFIPIHLHEAAAETPLSHSFDAGDGRRLAWTVGSGPDTCRRPLYGMEAFPDWNAARIRNLLFVDGEKTADAARLIFANNPEWLVLSGMGGSNAVLRGDWEPLMTALDRHDAVNIVVWPDADDLLTRPDGTKVDRQEKYTTGVMTAIFQSACDTHFPGDGLSAFRVSPPEGKSGGWDLADALDEGWSASDVLRHIDLARVPVDPSTLALRSSPAPVPVTPTITTPATPALNGAQEMDNTMIENLDEYLADASAANVKAREAAAFDALTVEPVVGVSTGTGAPVEVQVLIEDDESYVDGRRRPTFNEAVFDNPYFRCLGHRDGADYIINLESCHIYCLTPSNYKPTYLMRLARKDWWMTYFPGSSDRAGKAVAVNWDAAYDALISASYSAGTWEASREVGQGACIDGGRIVFNTGSVLFVDGEGVVPIRDFRGDNCYTIDGSARMPAFDNPFGPNEPGILKLLEIIQSLNWQKERRDLSIMALFGWIAIGPIAGILKWRPHLWLDGPRSSGKSWITDNLIAPALGSYCLMVKANSTESGIRNSLNGKAFPLIFDEAEGETKADRERVDMIIRLARHSASEGSSVVLQGTSGGGGQRHFSIRSPFLFSSITPQLDASADKTRFAHAHLGEGRDLKEFVKDIEGPAQDLLTPEFSDRMIARIVMRARDYHATQAKMTEALTHFGLERRIVDVYGTFATGAWLMLEDGVPPTFVDAITFIQKHFDIVLQIKDFGSEVRSEKDHNRIFGILQSSVVQVDCRASGPRREPIGNLIASAAGYDAGDSPLTQQEAIQALHHIGIRPVVTKAGARGAVDWRFIVDGEQASAIVIHRNAAPLAAFLEKSGYARSYSQVMLQAMDVSTLDKVVRFAPSIGVGRAIVVPLANFSIGEPDEQQ